jgi:hypothetical protein
MRATRDLYGWGASSYVLLVCTTGASSATCVLLVCITEASSASCAARWRFLRFSLSNGYEALLALEILHPLLLRSLEPRPSMPPLQSYLGYSQS